ncbi:hypothetical protein HK098_007862 [Nowakowskiella sp. JEL0407]|nr:hypothetical protein HK098_007862 [Nowakowskiella sp. JEL0407]
MTMKKQDYNWFPIHHAMSLIEAQNDTAKEEEELTFEERTGDLLEEMSKRLVALERQIACLTSNMGKDVINIKQQ